MQIICISHGSHDFSDSLAKDLAAEIGYSSISRQRLVEKATEYGIPVGKLEIEILKKRPISESLGIEMDLYKSFVAAELCSRALEEGIVYNGRTSHLALPRVSNILRVRAIAGKTDRIQAVAKKMNLNLKKATQYIEQTDDDILRWVRTLYNQDWNNQALYDLTINTENLSTHSTIQSLAQLAKLPEFKPTAASNQAVSDLVLAARCRLAIGKNDKTHPLKVTVKAEKGHVNVTYLPHQAKNAAEIMKVLDSVKGASSYVCTVASTNILFIGEKFDPQLESFSHLLEVAEKWNAAVELMCMATQSEGLFINKEKTDKPLVEHLSYNGGILDDEGDTPQQDRPDQGVLETMNKLIEVGRAGSSYTTHGGVKGMLKDIPNIKEYGLVVVGDVFSSKGGAKQRLKRDLVSQLVDKFRIPVLAAEDLKSQYLFGIRQLLNLLGFGFLSMVLYLLIFNFQEPILSFVSVGQFSGSLSDKIVAAVTVTISIPFVAFTIGGFYHNLLKLIRLE